MRVVLIIILFFIANLTLGQRVEFHIEATPTISFLTENSTNILYAVPINPATGYNYKIYDNTYKRFGQARVGVNIGAGMEVKLVKQMYLISGISFNYLSTRVTTSMSSSTNYKSLTAEHTQLILGETIEGYISSSHGNVAIDENGLLIVLEEEDYNLYEIDEYFNSLYFSIPLKAGFPICHKLDISIGVINSFLIYSKHSTNYPYMDERIIENNISTISEFLFSAEGGVIYKVSNSMRLLLNYRRSIGNIIDLNSRYEVPSGSKINSIQIGINYVFNKHK